MSAIGKCHIYLLKHSAPIETSTEKHPTIPQVIFEAKKKTRWNRSTMVTECPSRWASTFTILTKCNLTKISINNILKFLTRTCMMEVRLRDIMSLFLCRFFITKITFITRMGTWQLDQCIHRAWTIKWFRIKLQCKTLNIVHKKAIIPQEDTRKYRKIEVEWVQQACKLIWIVCNSNGINWRAIKCRVNIKN